MSGGTIGGCVVALMLVAVDVFAAGGTEGAELPKACVEGHGVAPGLGCASIATVVPS